MNMTFTLDELTTFISGLIDAAKNDEHFDVAWFEPTKNSAFSIVGGWQDGYEANMYDDMFCMSKTAPTCAMSVKICVNNGTYAYADFETLPMPETHDGRVDDNSLSLEWDDDPAQLAEFFMLEWERLMLMPE
jgi:hypothetical protein